MRKIYLFILMIISFSHSAKVVLISAPVDGNYEKAQTESEKSTGLSGVCLIIVEHIKNGVKTHKTAGTGTFFKSINGRGFVLTAAHVVEAPNIISNEILFSANLNDPNHRTPESKRRVVTNRYIYL